ncbi:Methyltransferase domain-containing protein [Desulfarculales bacterium]
MSPQAPWNFEKIQATASGYWGACALHAAVQTGVMAALAQAPASAGDLCQRLELDRRGLDILLRALLVLGLVNFEDDLYVLDTQAAPCFTPGQATDMSNAILHMADMVKDWAQLAQCLRRGEPVERPAHRGPGPDPGREHFYRAMRDIARQQARGLAARLGLKPDTNLLDMGGGPGVYALTFSKEVPGLKAKVYDLPGAEPYFREEAANFPDVKVAFVQGDYLKDAVLGGGPYQVAWLSQILHGEGPEQCRAMLAKATQALAPGGELWVQEFVVTVPGHPFAGLFGLNMLVNTQQGQAYTLEELVGMLEQAGLEEVAHLGFTKEGGPAGLVRGRKPR